MERFDWQTEEEGPIAPVTALAPASKRPGRMAALIFAVLLALALLAVWQIGRRAVIQEQAVKDDVKAAFNVWNQAMIRRDGDLLDTLLLDGEASWTSTQRELLTSGRSLDRSGIGLALADDELDTLDVRPEIEVSGDWRAAEIRFPLSYSAAAGTGMSSVVRLEQTVALVREGSRWLLRRPEEAFWGAWRNEIGNIAEVVYREKDAEVAERFLDDLDRDLSKICATAPGQGACTADTALTVRLESEAQVLLREIDQDSPAFAGQTFVLPSPTLVGNPLDDAGYQALYTAYSRPILKTFEASLAAPISLPEQDVKIICFGRNDNLPRLFNYNPAADAWSHELEGSAFRYLTADEDDSRIALRQHMPREPNRLRVVQWAAGQASVLHDEVYGPLTEHGMGWVQTAGNSGLLLAIYQGTTRNPSYHLVEFEGSDANLCLGGQCSMQRLDGFPRWSPDGAHGLTLASGELQLTSSDGATTAGLGDGDNPFWIDERRFGFIRPLGRSQRQIQELVIGAINGPEPMAVWDTSALSPGLFGASTDAPFYIQYVEPSAGRLQRLLLYGRQYASGESRYAVFSLPLAEMEGGGRQVVPVGRARLELTMDKAPAGITSMADPNNHVPFVVSPDGRWVTTAHLVEQGESEWVIQVAEIGHDTRLQFTTGYPGYAFSHPFFDWSADGRWLLLVDEEFIRLIAPEAGFERIVAHDNSACSFPAWIDRQGGE